MSRLTGPAKPAGRTGSRSVRRRAVIGAKISPVGDRASAMSRLRHGVGDLRPRAVGPARSAGETSSRKGGVQTIPQSCPLTSTRAMSPTLRGELDRHARVRLNGSGGTKSMRVRPGSREARDSAIEIGPPPGVRALRPPLARRAGRDATLRRAGPREVLGVIAPDRSSATHEERPERRECRWSNGSGADDGSPSRATRSARTGSQPDRAPDLRRPA